MIYLKCYYVLHVFGIHYKSKMGKLDPDYFAHKFSSKSNQESEKYWKTSPCYAF